LEIQKRENQNKPAGNKRLAKKRVQWLIETMCNAFSFEVVEKIELRYPLIRQAPFVMGKFKNQAGLRKPKG